MVRPVERSHRDRRIVDGDMYTHATSLARVNMRRLGLCGLSSTTQIPLRRVKSLVSVQTNV